MQSCGSATVLNQAVWLNANGIRTYYCPSLTLGGNRVYSNTGYGVSVERRRGLGSQQPVLRQRRRRPDAAQQPRSPRSRTTRFYRNATVNLRLAGTHNNVRVANNILSSSGSAQTCIQFDTIGTSWLADYNDYFVTNGAVLWNWKGPRYSLAALAELLRHGAALDLTSTRCSPIRTAPTINWAGASARTTIFTCREQPGA